MVQPNGSPTLNPPAPGPSNGENLCNTEAPRTRKLGKHHPKMLKSYGENVISPSPTEAPQTVEKMHSTEESSSSIQTSPIDPNNQENVSDQGQGILPRKQHHSVDKSIAGGGVILLQSYGENVISPSPTEAPQTVEKMHSTEESSSSIQTSPIDPNNQENVSDQGQGILPRKQHHSVDKSIAGGGVILGGLATTFLVAVFCYIRATGRHKDKAVAETVA
ncbi:hypothetical protein CFP56_030340 [Quercus suber]|uniref:Uncharacterized protein n=1 Tax=Quercus suber TaxID=58331 RepID=A0AAW0JNQ2_QUESU